MRPCDKEREIDLIWKSQEEQNQKLKAMDKKLDILLEAKWKIFGGGVAAIFFFNFLVEVLKWKR